MKVHEQTDTQRALSLLYSKRVHIPPNKRIGKVARKRSFDSNEGGQ